MTYDEAVELVRQGQKIRRQGWADVAVGAGERGSMWVEMRDDPLDDGDTTVPPHPFLVIERSGQPQRAVRYVRTATDKAATDWIEVA